LKPSLRTWRLPIIGLAAFAILLAACGGDDSKGGTSTTTSGSGSNSTTAGSGTDYSSLSGTLQGSGSTFQKTFIQAATAGFQTKAPKVTVTYAGGGSGQGKTDLANKVVDYAGTDSLIKPEDVSKYASGGGVLYFPTVAAPITISYNLSGVDDLKLDGPTLAKIFSGKITKWDDTAIKSLNSGASLPSKNITIAVRADASGTTTNFSKYLVSAGGSDWTLGSSDTITWPSSAQKGTGNPGVAQIVKSTDGAIGYVDLADSKASNLQQAQIKNKSGTYEKPTLDGAAAAVASATVAADLTYNPIDAAGADSYPITSPTYIIVYKKQSGAKGAAVKGFLNYILTDGQQLANQAGYAPLPSALAQKAVAQLDQLQVS
jgi:phosphate transport system substrate-binding protein